MDTYAAERGVKLQLQLADTINHQLPDYQLPDYQLPADGKALQQALVNLINNALKHSPKGDVVTVGLEMERQKGERGANIQRPTSNIQHSTPGTEQPAPRITDHVSRFTHHASRLILWVEDHGEGIPASEHEKIFERFYRPGSELRRQTQGVGIGLSIVKHIVEAHGGQVLVRSAVGQGSRFTIELPVSETTIKPEARNPKSE
jgi:signal transduction histidine kinase